MEEFFKIKKVQSQEVFLGFFSVLEMLYLEVVHCSAPGISSLYIGITGDFLDSWKMKEYLRKTKNCHLLLVPTCTFSASGYRIQ